MCIRDRYYGALTPLNQISNINTPDAQTISIQPWEKDKLQDIEKAILTSNLGFNPMNNGESILINIPPLTEERRIELVKVAKSEVEKAKVSIRNSRKDANNEIRKSDFSDDLKNNYEQDIQELTDNFIKKIDTSKRNFLTGSVTLAGVAAATSVLPISIANANHKDSSPKGLPDFISWKDRDALIVHSDKGIETHRSAIGESLITPNRNIYIRNNMPTMTDKQIGDRKKWKVSIEGVKNPQTFTLAQLQKLGHETMATIIQCTGIGRAFFHQTPTATK